MNADDLPTAWQAQDSQRRITLDVDVLLREVRRNHRSFRSMIFWRDFREVGVALLFAPLAVWWAKHHWGLAMWPWYVLAVLTAWVGVYMLLDRFRRRRKRPTFSDTLLGWAEGSLADVEHQIRLLTNVLWWCLLPPAIGIALFYAYLTWHMWREGVLGLCLPVFLVLWAVTTIALVGVYWLNQRTVKTELRPRQQELQALIDSLTGDGDPQPPAMTES